MLHNWKGRIAEEVDVGAFELHLASPSSPAVAIPVWMGSSPSRASGWRDVRRWRRRKRVEKGGREGAAGGGEQRRREIGAEERKEDMPWGGGGCVVELNTPAALELVLRHHLDPRTRKIKI